MAAPSYYRATYSRDGHKRPRNRKWIDGYLCQQAEGILQLLDEEGRVLTTGKAPAGGGSLASSDLDCFGQSFLVTVDDPCAAPASQAAGLAGGQASLPPGALKPPPQRPTRRDENAAEHATGAGVAPAAAAAAPDKQQSLQPTLSAANRKAFNVPRPSAHQGAAAAAPRPLAPPARPQQLSTVAPAPGARSGKQCTALADGLKVAAR